eukprot:CAMPEP_0184459096 /NCGR_PEP_ID=MMETSP0740-20130409/35603_1 /TAXON_ID=385413 /ORGANISM="Thalassiosira miniscula, Strain CCMP1093" /LENGTH=40 /DNA_ID= /DNA_START= /DNA_END= /DNA_ORIENTATION=
MDYLLLDKLIPIPKTEIQPNTKTQSSLPKANTNTAMRYTM